MPDNIADLLERVCEAITVNPHALSDGRRRQAATFANREADYLPICFGAPVPELSGLPDFNWSEQFHDPAKSLYTQLRSQAGRLRAGSDSIAGVRADLGVICVPSVFGIGYTVPEQTKPWTTERVPLEILKEFKVPEDVSALGVMPRLIEHTQHHLTILRERGLSDSIPVHHCDLQGAFDIACQSRGHDIFTDMYDDPGFVHRLMEQSAKAYIVVGKLCKRLSGEPLNSGNASGLWSETGGVRACDDSGILLNEGMFREFIQPYHVKTLEAFGGGWMHYCGGVRGGGRREGIHLHAAYLENPWLRGMNFSTGGDMAAQVSKIAAAGRFAYVSFERGGEESLGAYFRRVLSCLTRRKGLIFEALLRKDEWRQAKEEWHAAQDEILPKPG
ncbi:MAG TPA: uroporphyrinogen decarboxylase family protein [Candidatus Brocadiia bacterium]|nr:uroporphyrinogen decarboxylase family protein [Candidatus Brocadiia bacterium]